jgi:hypothetical protein
MTALWGFPGIKLVLINQIVKFYNKFEIWTTSDRVVFHFLIGITVCKIKNASFLGRREIKCLCKATVPSAFQHRNIVSQYFLYKHMPEESSKIK